MSRARFPGFYRLSVSERLKLIRENEWLSAEDADALARGRHLLKPDVADKMIENVIGTMGLPLGVGLGFLHARVDADGFSGLRWQESQQVRMRSAGREGAGFAASAVARVQGGGLSAWLINEKSMFLIALKINCSIRRVVQYKTR